MTTPVVIREKEMPPPSARSLLSLFPIKEAARAKVSVSVLLLLGVALGAYYLGSQRHDEQLRALKAELAGLKASVENCSKSK